MCSRAEFARNIDYDDEQEQLPARVAPILRLVIDTRGTEPSLPVPEMELTSFRHLVGLVRLQEALESSGSPVFGELPDPNSADAHLAHEFLGPDFFDEP